MTNYSKTVSLVFLVASQTLFGQESRLYLKMQEARKTNVIFQEIAFQEVSPDTAILKEFFNPEEVLFLESLSDLQFDKETKAIEIVIPLKSKNNLVLELLQVSDYQSPCRVVTSSGDTSYLGNSRNTRFYRGAIKGLENSFSSITFSDNEITGFVAGNNSTFEFVTDKSSGKYIFYDTKNWKTQQHINRETVPDFSSISYSQEKLLWHPKKLIFPLFS